MKALAPVLVTAPTTPLLTVDEARAHLRVDHTDENDYITALIAAATSYVDGYAGVLGRALITQTWEQSFSDFPACQSIRIPLGPLQAIESVTYYDPDGAQQTLEASKFYAVTDSRGSRLELKETESWPSTEDRPDAVTIQWTCGYGDAATDVPAAVLHAVRLLIGGWYEGRESGAIPDAVRALLMPLRAVGV